MDHLHLVSHADFLFLKALRSIGQLSATSYFAGKPASHRSKVARISPVP